MKKMLGSVSRKDLIFISIVLVALLAMIALDSDVEILVNYDEEMLQITSPRLNIDIEHPHVCSVELIDMPADFGKKIGDSYEHEAYCAGTWEHADWGTYTLCVLPENRKCIMINMDFTKVVFCCTTDEKTEALFESYTGYISSLSA